MSPQRVADAANIRPYPFVVRQERLPLDNVDRKHKNSKPRLRTERNPRQEEEIRFNTGPRNLRGAQINRGTRRPFRMLGRYDRGYDDHIGTVVHPNSYPSALNQNFPRHPRLSAAIVPRGDNHSSTLSMLQHNNASPHFNATGVDSGGYS
jgi:hypothetical protein